MAIDKTLLATLKRFAQAFRDARERQANESDTVMFLVKFFEEAMGYDSLSGEISKEVAIKDRYCDLALKLDGTIACLVEAKAAGHSLRDKDIEQAENYAARHGIRWVVLTNGVEWQLYHLSFAEGEGEGIVHDLAFSAHLIDGLAQDPEALWETLKLISKSGFEREWLEDYWTHRKALAPASLIRGLFCETVLKTLRRELNRTAEIRLDMEDVLDAVKEVLSKDALLAAGDISMTKKRKKRRRKKEEGDTAVSLNAAASEVMPTAPMPGASPATGVA